MVVDFLFIDPPSQRILRGKATRNSGGNLPNMGICILAAVLEREGYRPAILDAMAMRLSARGIVDKVLKLSPKYIGLTAMTHTISAAAEVAKIVKKILSETTIILGGVHVTSAPEETLRRYDGCFDVAVIGEGEVTIVELLKTLERKESLDNVAGIAYLRDDIFVKTKPADVITNLDSLPMPAWHLLPDLQTFYRPHLISAGSNLSNHLLTSRGCPGQCVFCDTSVTGHRVRGYSADYVLEMIDVLHKKYHISDLQINDDTFVTLRRRLEEICHKLILRRYDLTWSCDARASDVTKEGLKLMKAAGCWQVAYGVETGSQRIMDFLKKRVTFEQIHNGFRWTKEAGISTKGFFILGHPTETKESAQETLSLMLSLDADVIGVTFFTVYPGSPIYPNIRQYGEFDPNWDMADTYAVGNFVANGFTPKELIKLRNQALSRFYFRPRYLFKQLLLLKKPYQFLRLAQGAFKMLFRGFLNFLNE